MSDFRGSEVMVPLHGEQIFNQAKVIPKKETETIVPDNLVAVSGELPSQNQSGFGKKDQEDEDEVVATGDMDEKVLKAFETPIMNTAVYNYEPNKKVKRQSDSKVGAGLEKRSKLKFI